MSNPISMFSATPLKGMVPLNVTFINQSTNSSNWLWNFGDNTTSTVQNPTHQYTTSGIYTVSLTVTNINGSNKLTKKKYIRVLSNIILPIPSFSATPLYGASPLVVKFKDTSGGVPNKWLWDFGDKIKSSIQNPTHVYSLEGTYTVKLTATNNRGSKTITKTEYITVLDPADIPIAKFSASVLVGFPPLTIPFIDESIGNNLSWSWNFGDGSTSNLQNPSHIFTQSGVYTICLMVKNNAGSDIASRLNYINVLFVQQKPVSSFNASPLTGTVPIPINFMDTSINLPKKWLWDFGDGIKSNVQYPIHTYSSSGSFNVKLQVSNDAGHNTLVKEDYIIVLPAAITPIASFFGAPITGSFPLSVDFTDASLNTPTNWFWDFGDGTSSSLQNPNHVYTIIGTYNVSLTVLNNAGSNILTRPGYVNVISDNLIPNANFIGYPLIVNINSAVAFTDLSTNNPTSWLWNFGDGATSTVQNPSHSYSTLGMYYTVTLVVTNTYGTDTLILNDYIYVSSSSVLQANFKATPLIGPPGIVVSFFDLSTGNPIGWLWNFGDGGTSTLKNPTHLYDVAGIYNVTLRASTLFNNNTLIMSNYINITNVSLPVAAFSGTPLTGISGVVVTFTDLSLGNPTVWLWNFGDGTSSNLRNPVKTFLNVGFYTINLTVTNSYGKNTLIKNNYIRVTQF